MIDHQYVNYIKTTTTGSTSKLQNFKEKDRNCNGLQVFNIQTCVCAHSISLVAIHSVLVTVSHNHNQPDSAFIITTDSSAVDQ